MVARGRRRGLLCVSWPGGQGLPTERQVKGLVAHHCEAEAESGRRPWGCMQSLIQAAVRSSSRWNHAERSVIPLRLSMLSCVRRGLLVEGTSRVMSLSGLAYRRSAPHDHEPNTNRSLRVARSREVRVILNIWVSMKEAN